MKYSAVGASLLLFEYSTHPHLRTPILGYCFGAPVVLDVAATDDVAAGAIIHPAFLTEEHFEKCKGTCTVSYPHELLR